MKTSAARAEINVTPLVDVVLVLLIIFMVMTPMMKAGYDVGIPPSAPTTPVTPPPDQLIVRLAPGGETFINQERIADAASFGGRLREIVRDRRPERVFFACDPAVPYADAVRALDTIRHSGEEGRVVPIGIVLEKLREK